MINSSLLRTSSETQNKTYSILLAEDDIDDQNFIIEIIHQIDKRWRVTRAVHGQQVLNTLERLPQLHYPDLLLLDYQMPVLNGEEVLLSLAKQQKYQRIPKIIFTSTIAGPEKTRCVAAGAIGYLKKSEKASEMKCTLQNILKQACAYNPNPALAPLFHGPPVRPL